MSYHFVNKEAHLSQNLLKGCPFSPFVKTIKATSSQTRPWIDRVRPQAVVYYTPLTFSPNKPARESRVRNWRQKAPWKWGWRTWATWLSMRLYPNWTPKTLQRCLVSAKSLGFLHPKSLFGSTTALKISDSLPLSILSENPLLLSRLFF